MSNATRLYINAKPSAYDGLGEISWQIGDTHCGQCNTAIPASDILTPTSWYDGLIRQTPTCPHCRYPVDGGLPVDPNERTIFEAKSA